MKRSTTSYLQQSLPKRSKHYPDRSTTNSTHHTPVEKEDSQYEQDVADEIGATKAALKASTTASQENLKDVERQWKEIDALQSDIVKYDIADEIQRSDVTHRIGAGLNNLGNTCFLNSVLQCLTHTPPLATLSLSRRKFPQGSFYDVLDHIQQALNSSGSIVPTQLVSTMRDTFKLNVKNGEIYRQEDAHEYLRTLLDACRQSDSEGSSINKNFNGNQQIYTIFGGTFCSQIKCKTNTCDHVSSTLETFLDISLEIHDTSCLEKALQQYTKLELLKDQYRCAICGLKDEASKQLWIEDVPNILTIHLKRFGNGASNIKINKKVTFPKKLDITSYIRQPDHDTNVYNLYAVLVHDGNDTSQGHYYSYVWVRPSGWYLMDDFRVTPVEEERVLHETAYILFYVRAENKLLTDQNAELITKKEKKQIHSKDSYKIQHELLKEAFRRGDIKY